MSEEKIGRREFVELAAATTCGAAVFSGVLSDPTTASECMASVESKTGLPNGGSSSASAGPLTSLADLHRGVAAVISSKRVGTPVFVRYTWHGSETGDVIIGRLAQIAASARDWIGQPLASVYSVGTIESGQVSLSLQFSGGATALVSFTRGSRGGLDLMLVGNHGTLYHDAGAARLWNVPPEFDLQAADATLFALVQQALQSPQPIRVKAGTP